MQAADPDAAPGPVPDATPPAPAAPFVPVSESQRIEALDVVRGFALLGIFLMNIEGFNRHFGDILGRGIPLEAKGLDWAASFFVNYFVQGKFWTIFSMLFGMGFAVMLVRAEQAGRPFVKVYLRRILALAVFGAVHYIFIWEGDILFSYAVGALMLMLVLYGRPRMFLVLIAVAGALGVVAEPFLVVAAGLTAVALVAVYLRSDKRLGFRGRSMPVFCFILLLVGAGLSIAATVLWLLPDGPVEPRLPMSVFGPLLLITGWLSWRYHEPAARRPLRLAVSLYVFAGVAMTAGALVQHFTPDPLDVLTAAAKQEAADTAAGKDKPGKSKAQRAAEMKQERERQKLERETERAADLKLMTQGSYLQLVESRGGSFREKAAGDFGFGVVLVGMFMLGMGFVRSGVMDNTREHLQLFRRMAWIGLPLGFGLSLAAAAIAVSHVPGERYDGWRIAGGLHMLGNLPACLGYIGLVVVMLHSRGPASSIRVLAPMGRMALTNYLMQSVICSLYFYHHGLGQFGMPRAQQLVFAVVVFAAQVAFSHWWLARFRYGPMEWLWRGFTYRQVPPMRVDAAASAR